MQQRGSGSNLVCLILLLLAAVTAACDLPRDPEDTLTRVQGGALRVGISPNPPWTGWDDELNEPLGVEPAMVELLAEELDARIIWLPGPESSLLPALAERELDLVVGGLTEESAGVSDVGTTSPYFTETIAVGVRSPALAIDELAGEEIAVVLGSETAGILAEKDAIPIRVRRLTPAYSPLAAPTWLLAAWGMHTTDIELQDVNHIWAVPPGENGWLYVVDRFLYERRDQVEPRLVQETAE